MNIQIFGTKKCNDTKKAERFFKERGIKYQFIDMKEKGMSKGELTSVASANGGLTNMVNPDAKSAKASLSFASGLTMLVRPPFALATEVSSPLLMPFSFISMN